MVSQASLDDLRRSGLSPTDMLVRDLTASEKAATGCSSRTDGYVIPYFSLRGSPLPFYRVKVLTTDLENGVKYKQPRKTPNHIYFPPGFYTCLVRWCKEHSSAPIVVITEGEKKAACAVKLGIPCVALGGVDSWRSRTLVLPKDTELYSGGSKKEVRATLPATDISIPEIAQLATGFGELIDVIQQHTITPVIVYDSDKLGTLKADVQRAATSLAYELRFLGIPSHRIKQVIVPDLTAGTSGEAGQAQGKASEKAALDDYLLHPKFGPKDFVVRLERAFNDPKAFPKHPNPKGFINAQLEGVVGRKDAQQIASVVLSELDARGLRLRDSATGQPFYYDGVTHKLMPAVLIDRGGNVLHESIFGTLLYQEFGLSGNDHRVLVWLASQFTGEDPIKEVQPRRVITLVTEKEDPTNPDGIAIQCSDSAFFAISPDPKKPVTLKVNGSDGLLFEQNQVEPLDADRVLELFDEFLERAKERGRLSPWWFETLADSNMGKGLEGSFDALSESGKRMREYAMLLFYVSPFLQRWRGIQLPVELMLGEAGSGKSSLYSLRLQVLTGRPQLRNLPTDIRDWQASLANAGGLHVVDNVHFSNRDLKQRISDEICRLITEPSPSIEMRKLYTNADQVRIPVSVTFAMTAIQMPFQNGDLIQRAAVFQASPGKLPDGDWVQKQLDTRGGREAWFAHHLVFLHLFLKYATAEGWSGEFKTEHRLAHLEQSLTIAAKVVGIDYQHIGSTMKDIQIQTLTESDWTLNGLKAFIEFSTKDLNDNSAAKWRFTAGDISSWAQLESEHADNPMITNSRKIGRYMSSNRAALQRVLGIQTYGVMGNKVLWGLCVSRGKVQRPNLAARADQIADAPR